LFNVLLAKITTKNSHVMQEKIGFHPFKI